MLACSSLSVSTNSTSCTATVNFIWKKLCSIQHNSQLNPQSKSETDNCFFLLPYRSIWSHNWSISQFHSLGFPIPVCNGDSDITLILSFLSMKSDDDNCPYVISWCQYCPLQYKLYVFSNHEWSSFHFLNLSCCRFYIAHQMLSVSNSGMHW